MPRRDERTKPGDRRQIEYRAIPATSAGMQRRADGEPPGFTGHASTYWALDSYQTVVAPGAFTKTLSERGDRIPHLWQHDPYAPIGYHRAIRSDDTGLFVDVELSDDGAEGSVAIKRLRTGVPLGMSFGFQTIRERPATDADPLIFPGGLDALPEWMRGELPGAVWVIEEVKLYETSTVTFPANEAATIDAVRSQREALALTQLLDDLRGGRRLDDTVTTLIADIAAAWTDRPERTASPPNGLKARHITTDDRRAALRFLAETTGIDPALMGLTEVLPA